jgi:hypothetical protein
MHIYGFLFFQMNPMEAAAAKKQQERETLRNIIAQWNANRLDLFELSEPNEVSLDETRSKFSNYYLSFRTQILQSSPRTISRSRIRDFSRT